MDRYRFSLLLSFFTLYFFLMDASAFPQMPPSVVSVSAAVQKAWQPTIAETGTLIAEHGIVVKSEVDGRITTIFFQPGQLVQKDSPLIQLNPDVLSAQLKQYEAELTLTQLAYSRYKGLYEKKVVSEADYDQAVSNYQSSEAKVEQARAELNQLLIRAPFTGKVGLQQVNIGDYVSSGDPIVNLQSVDPIYADFNVPEAYISSLQSGQTFTIASPAYPGQKFHGTVLAMESLIDPDTRTLKVRGILPNKDGKLIPGAFVEVTLSLGKPKKIIIIPNTALIHTIEGDDAVYKVKDGKAQLTKIKVLKQLDSSVLVESGLKLGDKVVTAGQLKLHDQAAVTIAKIDS